MRGNERNTTRPKAIDGTLMAKSCVALSPRNISGRCISRPSGRPASTASARTLCERLVAAPASVGGAPLGGDAVCDQPTLQRDAASREPVGPVTAASAQADEPSGTPVRAAETDCHHPAARDVLAELQEALMPAMLPVLRQAGSALPGRRERAGCGRRLVRRGPAGRRHRRPGRRRRRRTRGACVGRDGTVAGSPQ